MEITPAALTLSASTPMVHIIALAKQGLLETDETAQVRFLLHILLLSFKVTANKYLHCIWRNA